MGDIKAEGERRQAERKSVLLSATVRRGGISTPVRLTNISSSGASIAADGLPMASMDLKLERSGTATNARVVWVRSSVGGLRFEEPVDVVQLLRPIADLRPVQPGASRRPPLNGAPLSDIERASVERCCNLLGIRGWQ